MRQVKEIGDDGKEVTKAVPEMVQQTYTVMIPYQANKEGAFAIPGKGDREQDATTKGFIFRQQKIQDNNQFSDLADDLDRIDSTVALSSQRFAR